MSFDLGWGEPVCVREVLDAMYNPTFQSDLKTMSYPDYNGKPELVAHVKRLLGYKHITITNGTTGSINVVLRALAKAEGRSICVTHKPHFLFYSNFIEKAGYEHKTDLLFDNSAPSKKLTLVDIPSNPNGHILSFPDLHNNVIWDSVYANRVYVNTKAPFTVQHRVNVGSFSKWLGITGLRIGWIGTNNDADHELFYKENLYETCGISVPSQDLLIGILNKVNLEDFQDEARRRINYNRESFLKLDKFFDGQEIPTNGMFYPVYVDRSALKIIDRANVKYITLVDDGHHVQIRFNLAQNNKLTSDAIKAIKTADRIK